MVHLGTSLRPVGAVVATAGLGVGCWSWCHDERAALLGGSTAGLAVLVAGLAAVLLQVALTWLLLLTLLVALEPLAGRDLTSYAGCPPGLRRILLAGCGAAAAGMLAVPAQAAPAPSDPPAPHGHHSARPAAALLEGLPVPDRAVDALRRGPSETVVVVRPGDTLWAIAAARLPAGATDAAVDLAWHALYAHNRSRVGPDPDLLTPGTRLRIPTTPHQEDDR